MNVISVTGNISEPKFYAGEIPRMTFAIADKRWDRKKEEDVLQWVSCVVFGKRAQTFHDKEILVKGTFVSVVGHFLISSYEDREGVQRKSFSVICDDIEFRNKQKPKSPPRHEHAAGVERLDDYDRVAPGDGWG